MAEFMPSQPWDPGHPASLGSVRESLTSNLPSGTAWPVGLGQAHRDHFSPDGLTVCYIGTFIIVRSLLPCHRAKPNPRVTAAVARGLPMVESGPLWCVHQGGVGSSLRVLAVQTGARTHLCMSRGIQLGLLVTRLLLCAFLSNLEIQMSGLVMGLLRVTEL